MIAAPSATRTHEALALSHRDTRTRRDGPPLLKPVNQVQATAISSRHRAQPSNFMTGGTKAPTLFGFGQNITTREHCAQGRHCESTASEVERSQVCDDCDIRPRCRSPVDAIPAARLRFLGSSLGKKHTVAGSTGAKFCWASAIISFADAYFFMRL